MKVKWFYHTNSSRLESDINDWLKANTSIEVISTNSFANVGGWGYMILYKRK